MQRIVGTAVATLLAVSVVSGCGGDDNNADSSGGYCSDLQSAKDHFVGLLDNQIGQDTFDALRVELHTLKAEAPDVIAADWTTFSGAVDAFAVAMDKAGLTMDDMRDMGTGDMGGGTDMQTAMDAAAAMGSAAVSTAESRIASNAAKTCHVDLNG